MKNSSDLISGGLHVIIAPMIMLMDNIDDFRHRIAAELEEANKPEALSMDRMPSV
jgi:hypothetical protein